MTSSNSSSSSSSSPSNSILTFRNLFSICQASLRYEPATQRRLSTHESNSKSSSLSRFKVVLAWVMTSCTESPSSPLDTSAASFLYESYHDTIGCSDCVVSTQMTGLCKANTYSLENLLLSRLPVGFRLHHYQSLHVVNQ